MLQQKVPPHFNDACCYLVLLYGLRPVNVVHLRPDVLNPLLLLVGEQLSRLEMFETHLENTQNGIVKLKSNHLKICQ